MKRELSYIDSVHRSGRIWVLCALFMMIALPSAISTYYDSWPIPSQLLAGFMAVAPIFWTVGTIEVFTYTPMLGASGTYLGFVTGNLTSQKVPCALNAMEAAKVTPGSEEGEVVSSIAIATSTIVTSLILAAGVLLLSQLQPILEAPVLAPAYASILPALFGALGVVLISKNWKIAIAPLAVMLLLFIFIPALSNAVGVLVPVGALIALGAARILYVKGLI